ncbi:MAG: SDR family NAD(P)-dependent oxidoreductase, partial [Bacillota bacterium]
HSKTLNQNIDFAATAFQVNQELRDWQRPVMDGREQPRRAGVSSFGASGSNAHIVIEEYIPPQLDTAQIGLPPNPAIIVLTAKNQERLNARARQLVDLIDEQQLSDAALMDMAYSLQVGREAMEERMALVVRTMAELREKLQRFAEGRENIDGCYCGQVKQSKEPLDIGAAADKPEETVAGWLAGEDYPRLLSFWVKGLSFDWNKIYGAQHPRRISLPTYPFARERYWITDRFKTGSLSKSDAATYLHPLLHQNTSNFEEQRFSSIFTGKEFFLTDHVIQSQSVLPGVAYLEMARAAVVRAVGAQTADSFGIRLKNVAWIRPITVEDEKVPVHIRLFPEAGGDIAYLIYSKAESENEAAVIYGQGLAVLGPMTEGVTLDLSVLQAECSLARFNPVQCYEIFKTMGIEYGPAHQGIERVYVGPGQVLAKLSLPGNVSRTADEFILHPSMMDAALQASIALIMQSSDSPMPAKPALPFALRELEIFGRCAASMWAFIRRSDPAAEGRKVQKVDIDLCDDQGRICVRMKELSSRVLEGEIASLRSGTLMFHPEWQEQAVAENTAPPVYAEHIVLLCEPDRVTMEYLQARMEGARVGRLKSERREIAERYQNYVIDAFEEIQAILKAKPLGPVLIQVVLFTQQAQQRLFAGMAGLLRTVRLENPKLIGQLIEVEEAENPEGIINKLTENRRHAMAAHVRYHGGKRWVRRWREIRVSQTAERIPWKDQGVYLITGGAGGLGLIFAKEMASKIKGAVLALVGRTALSPAKQALLNEIGLSGNRVEYRRADVTLKEQVDNLIASMVEEFGGVDGIIHSAGLIRDNLIIKKNRAEVSEVLAPKVAGLVNLDQATRDLPLDFFILFSSGSGAEGNVGQADYAAANAFMDAYAWYRGSLVASKQRRGQTLSVNWPLWREGGMRIDAATEKILRQNTGIVAMPTFHGIKALYQALASGKEQVLVLEGDRRQLRAGFLGPPSRFNEVNALPDLDQSRAKPAVTGEALRAKAIHYFKQLLSVVLKLPSQRIEAETAMERYGIDSVMVMQLTNQLEQVFGSLSKTLFYEYPNLKELTDYFLVNYRERLIGILGVEDKVAIAGDWVSGTDTAKSPLNRGSNDRISANWKLKAKRNEDEIAIIGVSGRYPMADTMDEFWENLKNGRDCITEIPSDRWDWRQFYDLNQNCVGKSYSKWGGFIRDKFDPLIFNIAPREAKLMDPQERLFLQTVWHTLEDAGYSKSRVSGKKAGVFVGVMYGQYQLFDAVETSGKNLVPSSSYASIANRVSYYFDFSGPSIALDTMCSSSLTAIHLACQSIREGESDLAIAGGVNVTIHPHKYLLLSQGKFAASDGRCRSFGAGGDGYVPGEGVGAVLLKPLGQAEADGDHIYAVIKSSVLNHGGKTNGYSVPNPNAQAELISAALRKANCDPEKISYIEAHGTGTSLGDPIEITGLMKAYGAYHQEKQYCSIGSVKSNVGHLESAAGIVGVTKILLQMKYKQLVPSLHAEELNPHINFEASPFHVQQKLEDWRQTVMLENGLEKKYPRRAGISSFGAGGANAHIILEEWERDGSGGEQEERLPQIIVLSAKNKERLQEYCKLLARFLEKDQAQTEEMALADIAYTLQVGREPLEERLAIVVDSKRDLVEQLTLFVQEESVADSVRSGSVRAEPEKQGLFDDADEAADLVKLWWRKGKFLKIAELWVHGVNVNWMLLDRLRQPRRVSLPGYPFARDRYWLAPPFLKGKRAGSHAKLHPLLDTINLPMSYESGSIVFEKNLGQTDLIVKDHQVTGKFMFPGVGYLEMVCGALAQIHPRVVGRLAKVVWLRPLTVEADMKETRIIIKKENGVMRYEIQSGDTAHKVAHSKGEIYPETSNTGKSRDYLPLESIKARCNVIEPDIFYESFAANGILYGAYFKGVTGVWASLDEALGFICLPKEFKEEFEHYTLHPTLMDGSLQTIAAVGYGGARKDTGRSLPFAVEEVEILHPLQEKMYTYVKALGGRRYNLCMADESGLVCVKLDGVALREVKDSALNFFYLPVWRPEAVLPEPAPAETAGKSVLIIYSHPGEDLGQALAQAHVHDRVTTVCLGDETGREKENEWQIKPDHSGFDPCIEKLGSIDIIYYLGAIEDVTMDFSEPDACDASQERGIFSLFRLVKSLYSHQLGGKRLSLKVVTNNSIPISTDAAINPCAATLHGFTSSLAKENPAWGVRCLDISFGVVGCNPTDRDWAEWVNALVTEPADKKGAVVAYRRGTRYRRSIQPLRLQGAAQNPFKQHGVYLIVGGAGGIGGALSLYLAETVQARLVIVGRSDPDQEMSKKFAAIQSRGGEVLYVPADVANSENMKSAVAKGKSRFGGLDGVIHSALVLQDKTLVNMEEEALRAVLTPKVKGSIVLYNAVKEEKPDFIMFFSSAQSFGGNLGQSNYAAACTFQDAFAQYISQMGECPVKIINWGYWGDVGAVATEEYQKRMAAKGIYSIDSVR